MRFPRLKFRNYMLTENRDYLSQKLGDIVTAIESLHDDASHLSPRKLADYAKGVTDQIRMILKGSWPDTELSTLKVLQKLAVAILKGIDENADLKEILGTGIQELHKLSTKLQTPINDLASDAEYDDSKER